MLLAGGLGSRLKPLTDSRPKCLVPIQGKPLLEIWLETLLPEYAGSIILNTYYLAEQVETFVRQSPWGDRVVLSNEKSLLGTAGTLLNNQQYFLENSFMVVHADNLSKFDIAEFIKCHRDRAANIEITMMTFETDDPCSCGIVEVDEKGRVIGFHEKVPNPPGSLANGAIYIMEPSIFDFIRSLEKEVLDISLDILPAFLGKIQIYRNNTYRVAVPINQFAWQLVRLQYAPNLYCNYCNAGLVRFRNLLL